MAGPAFPEITRESREHYRRGFEIARRAAVAVLDATFEGHRYAQTVEAIEEARKAIERLKP